VLLALVAIGAVLWLALGPFERRLARLAEAAKTIGEGDYSPRLHAKEHDAVGEVARAFDEMAARVGRTLDDQRELVAGVSHELRTPLARLMFQLEAIEEARDDDERTRHLARAEASVDELNTLVSELLTLSRVGATPVDAVALALADVVRDAVDRVPVSADVRVTVEADDAIRALGDAALVGRCVQNLVANGVRHAASAVNVHVRRDGDAVELAVEDDGPGIPAADRERVFEPFTQLDASRGRRGEAGLGLAIVRRSVEAMGGSVRAEASALGGARLALRLPHAP
jgi:signal transduction histidine kinase